MVHPFTTHGRQIFLDQIQNVVFRREVLVILNKESFKSVFFGLILNSFEFQLSEVEDSLFSHNK